MLEAETGDVLKATAESSLISTAYHSLLSSVWTGNLNADASEGCRIIGDSRLTFNLQVARVESIMLKLGL